MLCVKRISGFFAAAAVSLFLASKCDFLYDPQELNKAYEAIELQYLRVRASDGTVLWQIRSASGKNRVEHVRYGTVPVGFVQEIPAGKPRSIRDGELLVVLAATRSGYLCSQGYGVSPGGLRQETYTSIPNTGTNAEWRDAVRDIERCTVSLSQ